MAGIAVLGLTFVIAVFRQVSKFRSPRATRQRNMNKNKASLNTPEETLFDKGGGGATGLGWTLKLPESYHSTVLGIVDPGVPLAHVDMSCAAVGRRRDSQ